MKKAIYADNAATTKLSEYAFNKMKYYLINDYGNPSQPYSFSRTSKTALRQSREMISNFIGAFSDEIYFTSGGSESDNWAIKGFDCSNSERVIIASSIEHHAVLNACKSVERNGTKIVLLQVDEFGIIDINQLENELEKNQGKKILVSIMLVNNEIGTIEPIKEISKLCHKYGALIHTDAVQAVGHININVNELGVDMLSASAHKFNGPRGVGFLFIRRGVSVQSFIDGGSQESKRRAGTENIPAIVGMAYALEESILALSETKEKMAQMEDSFIRILDLNNIDYVRNGDINNHLSGLLNISIRGVNGEMLLHRLDLNGIYISTGSACDGKMNQISHVIRAIKVREDYAEGTIRISFGKFNSINDAESIAHTLVQILKTKQKT